LQNAQGFFGAELQSLTEITTKWEMLRTEERNIDSADELNGDNFFGMQKRILR